VSRSFTSRDRAERLKQTIAAIRRRIAVKRRMEEYHAAWSIYTGADDKAPVGKRHFGRDE
jgi:hypothetical protein